MKLLRLLSPVLLALLLLLLIHAGLALADGPLAWQKLPGPEGGAVETIVFDPTDANTFYIGSNSGVLKSTDGGATWLLPDGADSPSIFAYSLVIDPLTPTTLYAVGAVAGTLPTVHKSVDGGQSWQLAANGLGGEEVRCLAINPVTPTILYVGTPNGVVKSADAGQSWQVSGTGLGNKQVLSLAVDPVSPDIVYAGTVNDGIYKSIDGGQNWQAINNGSGIVYGRSLAINPITPTTIYAAGGGVYKSVDGGQTWQATGQTDADFVVVDPITPSTLYAGLHSPGHPKVSMAALAGHRLIWVLIPLLIR